MASKAYRRTGDERHLIRRQNIAVQVPDPAEIPGLQSRIAALNREQFSPIIDSVFAEFQDHTDTLIIETLSLDLGHIPVQDLDRVAAERLRAALREELAAQISANRHKDRAASRRPGREDTLMGLVEHLLLFGTAGKNFPAERSTSLQSLVGQLIGTDAHPLARLLRRIGHHRNVVPRLIAQLDLVILGRLVRVLEPRHAVEILILAGAISQGYRQAPEKLSPIADIDKHVWSLIYQYILVEPGTQFNRREFVGSILSKMARDAGVDYLTIVRLIQAGLNRLDRRRRIRTSLPAILRAIARNCEPRALPHPPSVADISDLPNDTGAGLDIPAYLIEILSDMPLQSRSAMRGLLAAPPFKRQSVLRGLPRSAVARMAKDMMALRSRQLRLLMARLDAPAIRQILAVLDDQTMEIIVTRIQPKGVEEDSPFHISMRKFAALTGDKPEYYARVIHALLTRQILDFESFAAMSARPAITSPRAAEAEQWPRSMLQFLRTGRWDADWDRHLQLAGISDPDQAIGRLVSLHPENVRAALQSGMRDTRVLARLAARLSRPTLAAMMRVMAGIMREDMAQLAARLAQQPSYRRSARWQNIADLLVHNSARPTLQATRRKMPANKQARPLPDPDIRPAVGGATMEDAALQALDDLQATMGSLCRTLSLSGNSAEPELARHAIIAELSGKDSCKRAVSGLRRDQFDRMLIVLEPKRHKALRETAAVLFTAAARLTGMVSGSLNDRWRTEIRIFMLEFVVANTARKWSLEDIIAFFMSRRFPLVECRRNAAGKSVNNVQQLVFAETENVARRQGNAKIRHALGRWRTRSGGRIADRMKRYRPANPDQRHTRSHRASDNRDGYAPGTADPAETKTSGPARPPRSGSDHRQAMDRGRTSFAPAGESMIEGVSVANAGLVLAAPFLSHLFNELEFLKTDAAGKSAMCNARVFSRAVHLTQYLVTGECETPEALLPLNKLLCGGSAEDVVEAGIDLSDKEETLCRNLQTAMLANWPALQGGTSVAGLQETFLQRSGTLAVREERYDLSVDRKTLDILLDQVPWNFRTIFLPWQTMPLHVHW